MESINIFCIPSNINLIELSNLSAIFITFITRFIGLIDESITNILQCGSSLYTYLVLIDFYSFSNNFAQSFSDFAQYIYQDSITEHTSSYMISLVVYRNSNIEYFENLISLYTSYICTFG